MNVENPGSPFLGLPVSRRGLTSRPNLRTFKSPNSPKKWKSWELRRCKCLGFPPFHSKNGIIRNSIWKNFKEKFGFREGGIIGGFGSEDSKAGGSRLISNCGDQRTPREGRLVFRFSPWWHEGLLFIRCTVFVAVVSAVGVLLWMAQMKSREYVEEHLLPSVSASLSEYLQRELDLGKVRRISPLSITLQSCSVGPTVDEFSCVDAPLIKLRLHPFSSIRAGRFVIDAVLLQPTLLVAQKEDFSWLGIPVPSEKGWKRFTSDEEGIDRRTRIRRTARGEAAGNWSKEREAFARRAAETGYVVNHQKAAEEDRNFVHSVFLEPLTSDSFFCSDERPLWRDHHYTDNGGGYDSKHASLEKSFGFGSSASTIRFWPGMWPSPLGKRLKGRKIGKKKGVTDCIAVQRRLLERSASAAVSYFGKIDGRETSEAYADPLDYLSSELGAASIGGDATNNSKNLEVGNALQSNGGGPDCKLNFDDKWPKSLLSSDEKYVLQDETTTGSSRNLLHDIGDKHKPSYLADSQAYGPPAGGKLAASDKTNPNESRQLLDRSNNETNVGMISNHLAADHICSESRSKELTHENFMVIPHGEDEAHFDLPSGSKSFAANVIGVTPSPHGLAVTGKLELPSWLKTMVFHISDLLDRHIHRIRPFLSEKAERLAASFVGMVDVEEEIAIGGVDKMVPVTLDSVHFTGGTLMLLGYGDQEPREMENVSGHIRLQNHYGRVHVRLSGCCKEWRTSMPSRDGGWLSADVFVDIAEQRWHANLKVADLFAPLFERILEIPITWSKGRASGEVHICMSNGDTFPNIHGQLDVEGLEFQILESPAYFSEVTANLCFRGQRIFLHNTNGWFGDAPLEVSGDLGINPEEGEFHLMCQVPYVEVNALMKTLKMRPLLFPLAGSVTAVFNCQGPIDAPVIIGSVMISRRTAHSISRVPASLASEAMLKNREAGAIAAFDRIPFSYVSANFTYNMDNSVADLYGIRVSLLDGGEIRGAGNAWICPEGEMDDSALDINWSGSLSFDDVLGRYLPAEVQPLPVKIGYINGETKLSGSLLNPRFDIKWSAPNAEESFNDARGDIIISHDYMIVSSSSSSFEIYLKFLTSYPNDHFSDQKGCNNAKAPNSPVIDGVELDLRMRGFDFSSLILSNSFGAPKPLHLKATGRIKFHGLVQRPMGAEGRPDSLGREDDRPVINSVEKGASVLVGSILLSGIKLNQLMIAPYLSGSVNLSPENLKLDASGRPDENLMVEIVGPLWTNKLDRMLKKTIVSTSLQKGQFRANVYYEPFYSANLEVRNLPLDELEVSSLRGTIQKAELQLNFQKRRGHGSLSVIHPKFSGVQGEALDVSARWSGDVITIEKTVLEQLNSKYELQGEYVLPGTRDRYRAEEEQDGLLKQAMAGQLGRAISSMGRWRIRLEVPHAEVVEMLPLARFLSRSSDPAVRSRSKDFFMQSLQAAGFYAENMWDQLEAIHREYMSSDDVSLEDISLPGLAELRGHWRGSLDASGGGNGDTMADFDFHGEDWEWGAYKTQRVLAAGTYNNNDGLRLEKIFIQKDNATLHADGSVGPKTNLHFAVLNFPVGLVPALLQVIESSPTDAVHSLRTLLAPIKGILHMEGDLRGGLSKPQCDIQVRLLDGAVGGIDLGRAEILASLTSSSRFLFNANIEPVIQGGHVRIQGSIPVTPFDKDPLMEDEMDREIGRTKWFESWKQDKGKDNTKSIGSKKTVWDRNEDGREASLSECFKGLNLNIAEVGEVRIDADIKDGGMLLLTALFPYANWVHGSADIVLQVRGTMEQPILDGTASFHRASVSSPVLPKPLSNFGGTVTVKANHLSINIFESRVGRKGRLVIKGNLPLNASKLFPGDKIDLKCEVLEVRAKNVFSGQVDSQIQVTGSILQPDVSGMIKLSHGEAYLPHDKRAGATITRLTANRSSLPSSIYNRLASFGHVLRFFGSSTSRTKLPETSGKPDEVAESRESAKAKPQLDIHLTDLLVHLGPELKIIYPLILDFAVSGELVLNGLADPKWIKPAGVLTFENGDVNLVATQMRLKREHSNIAKFEPDQGLDPTLDLAFVGSEYQLRIQSRASNWQDNLVVTSTRSVEQDVLSPTEAAKVFESQLAELLLEGDGKLAFKKLITASLETIMPRIEGKGEFGQARWRLVYAPQIPSLLSLDPTIDPLKTLANGISFGTEVEVQLGRRLQASVVRSMKDSEIAMQWTLLYQLTSRLRVLFQSSPSSRLLFEYSATSQD